MQKIFWISILNWNLHRHICTINIRVLFLREQYKDYPVNVFGKCQFYAYLIHLHMTLSVKFTRVKNEPV